MTADQTLISVILVATLGMFLWGRWRHDMVAVGALLACVLAGLVPASAAFAGFGHPAVVTVACVLVLSRGLQISGAVDLLARHALPSRAGPTRTIAALTGLGALLSGFMNNVGALALLMPVAVQLAARLELPPGRVLMPLAFGSILGGTTTLIGTPPNLIVSGFRENAGLGGYEMFSFTPVGVAVAAAGVAFIALVGWRLVPARKHAGAEGFDAGAYVTETRVPEGSRTAGRTLGELYATLEELDAQLLGLVRDDLRVTAPHPRRTLHEGDILVLEADADTLAKALSILDLRMEEAKHGAEAGDGADRRPAAEEEGDAQPADEVVLMELAIMPTSSLVSRSARDILLRSRWGINLLAISRQGQPSTARLRSTPLRAGDLLLVQGPPGAIVEFAGTSGCVPLARRDLRIPHPRAALLSAGILGGAVAVAAVGLLPPAVAFAAGVLASLALRTVPPRAAYEAVDWSVVVLLAALLPVAGAMQETGSADLVARFLLELGAQGNPVAGVAVILVTTMILTDLMNNAATAAVMAPIGLGAATQLGVNPDTFLMAVAVGSSCAFLTPIGHQNNTLILGPGGYAFGDYWRMGLPLEAIILVVGTPAILFFWPL
jgi:di/tricarboxylate transporter